MKKKKREYTIGEILDFAETRGMTREDAWQELRVLIIDKNSGTYTARIRAIMEEMK